MKQKKQTNYILIFSLITLAIIIAGKILRIKDNNYLKSVLFLCQQMCYMGMITVWGLALRQRILNKTIKRDMTLATAFMLLWLLLRAMKYRFFSEYYTMGRYLWYLYYIPMVMIPFEFFGIATEINGFKHRKIVRRICLIISYALFLAILTNDLHGLAFKFKDIKDYDKYTHGIVYYLVVLSIAYNFIGGVFLLTKNTKDHRKKISQYKPLLWLILMVVYSVLYLLRPGILKEDHLIELPETMCLICLAIIETALHCNLILTNVNYPDFFKLITAPVMIIDMNGKIVYESSKHIVAEAKYFEMATLMPTKINEDTVLNSKKIKGGYIFWTESLKEINKLTRILSDITEELTGENDLLSAETELQEEKIRIDEKSKIYDEIDTLTEKQRKNIKFLLNGITENSEEYERRIKLACIYNAYVKRRSNLALISNTNDKISILELVYSMKESGDYLNLYGVVFGINRVLGDTLIVAEKICLIYDFFQELVEKNLEGLLALLVNIELKEDGLYIRFTIENPNGIDSPDGHKDFIYQFEKDDNTIYITLFVRGCY